jgi:hypothetical protein
MADTASRMLLQQHYLSSAGNSSAKNSRGNKVRYVPALSLMPVKDHITIKAINKY